MISSIFSSPDLEIPTNNEFAAWASKIEEICSKHAVSIDKSIRTLKVGTTLIDCGNFVTANLIALGSELNKSAASSTQEELTQLIKTVAEQGDIMRLAARVPDKEKEDMLKEILSPADPINNDLDRGFLSLIEKLGGNPSNKNVSGLPDMALSKIVTEESGDGENSSATPIADTDSQPKRRFLDDTVSDEKIIRTPLLAVNDPPIIQIEEEENMSLTELEEDRVADDSGYQSEQPSHINDYVKDDSIIFGEFMKIYSRRLGIHDEVSGLKFFEDLCSNKIIDIQSARGAKDLKEAYDNLNIMISEIKDEVSTLKDTEMLRKQNTDDSIERFQAEVTAMRTANEVICQQIQAELEAVSNGCAEAINYMIKSSEKHQKALFDLIMKQANKAPQQPKQPRLVTSTQTLPVIEVNSGDMSARSSARSEISVDEAIPSFLLRKGAALSVPKSVIAEKSQISTPSCSPSRKIFMTKKILEILSDPTNDKSFLELAPYVKELKKMGVLNTDQIRALEGVIGADEGKVLAAHFLENI